MLTKLWRALILCGFASLLAATSANAGPEVKQCTTPNEAVGSGMYIIRRCKANQPGFNDAGFKPYEAYYAAHVSITAGPGFESQTVIKKNSSAGKILGSMFKKLFGNDRAKILSIGWEVNENATTYPPIILMSFTRTDSGDFTSSIIGQGDTQLHYLPNGGKFTFKLQYFYTDRGSLDFATPLSVVTKFAPAVASDAATPFIDIAHDMATAAINANAVKVQGNWQEQLSPGDGGTVLYDVALKDLSAQSGTAPATVATVTIELRGERSLLASSIMGYDNLAGTVPAGAVNESSVGKLTSFVMTGAPARWSAIMAVLGPVGDGLTPIGAAPAATEEAIKQYCSGLQNRIDNDFAFSPIDALLLRAAAIERSTRAIRQTINPLAACFNPTEAAYIHSTLGYDVSPVVIAPVEVTGLRDKTLLAALGSWMKAGDCEGGAESSPLYEMLAPTVKIGVREGLPAENRVMTLSLPANREIDRKTFLDVTCRSVTRWHDFAEDPGQLLVNAKDGNGVEGGDLVVSGSILSKKMTAFSIASVGKPKPQAPAVGQLPGAAPAQP